MKIRQYRAATMQEAILKVKLDLGPDAVILHTRKVKEGGFLGFFTNEAIEVVAAVDPGLGRPAAAAPAAPAATPKPAVSAEQAAPLDAPAVGLALAAEARARAAQLREEQVRAQMAVAQAAQAVVAQNRQDQVALGPLSKAEAPAPVSVSAPTPEVVAPAAPTAAAFAPLAPPQQAPLAPAHAAAPWQSEVHELHASVGDLKAMLASVVTRLDHREEEGRVKGPAALLARRLVDLEMAPDLAKDLAIGLHEKLGAKPKPEALAKAAEEAVAALYTKAQPLGARPGKRRVVALVGPTGVGKTTTIAKLAAAFTLEAQAKLALLTIDTYRVAAMEQLKAYGDIIGLPVEVVATPSELSQALGRLSEVDIVLIDTAGRSPHHEAHLAELKAFLDAAPGAEVHLVLAATTKRSDLESAVARFQAVGATRLIVTKLDETEKVGGVLSAAHQAELPIAYVTTGQGVPDDIAPALEGDLERRLAEAFSPTQQAALLAA